MRKTLNITLKTTATVEIDFTEEDLDRLENSWYIYPWLETEDGKKEDPLFNKIQRSINYNKLSFDKFERIGIDNIGDIEE